MKGCDDLIHARFCSNISRVNGLIKFVHGVEALRQESPFFQNSEGVRADILRAVVVYLYATFEDALRTVARHNLAQAGTEALKDIPFVGGTDRKLTLSQVAEHRSKTVDQLVSESVQSYLDGKSFSSFEDVVHVLERLRLDTKPFAYFAKPLGQMMRRRHWIVHEGDLPNPQESKSEPWTVADNWQLVMWLLSVEAFYCLLRALLDQGNPAWRARHDRLVEAIEKVVTFGDRLLDIANAGDSDASTKIELLQKMAQSVDSVLNVLHLAKEMPLPL